MSLFRRLKHKQLYDEAPVIIYDASTGMCAGGYHWSPGMPHPGQVVIIDDIPRRKQKEGEKK